MLEVKQFNFYDADKFRGYRAAPRPARTIRNIFVSEASPKNVGRFSCLVPLVRGHEDRPGEPNTGSPRYNFASGKIVVAASGGHSSRMKEVWRETPLTGSAWMAEKKSGLPSQVGTIKFHTIHCM